MTNKLIAVQAKLPYMSTEMLTRVYGDKVEKLTMGFEVEVAVDANEVNGYGEPEEFDEDEARQRFHNQYQGLEFSKWATAHLQNENMCKDFAHNFGLEPRYGWCDAQAGDMAQEFLNEMHRMQLSNKGPGLADFVHGLSDAFNPEFYEFELGTVGPNKTPWIISNVGIRPGAPRVIADIFYLIGLAGSAILDEKMEVERKRLESVVNGLNLHMLPSSVRIGGDAAKKVVDIAILPDGDRKNLLKAKWVENVLICTVQTAKTFSERRGKPIFSRIWTVPSDEQDHRNGQTYDSLKNIFGKLYEAEDVRSLNLFDEIDIDYMQEEFETAQAEKETEDLDNYVDNARAQHERDNSEFGVDLKTSAIQFVRERFEIAFIDEDVGATVGYQTTNIVEDSSIEPAGAEIISAPKKPSQALDWLAEKFTFIEDTDGLLTNDSTGLHCGIGTFEGHYRHLDPKGTIDVLKLLLFLGDKHLLSHFGREDNSYVRNMEDDLLRAIKGEQLSRETGALNKSIYLINDKLVRQSEKYLAANLSKLQHAGYIEFRIMGGADYHLRFPDVKRTAMRFAQICVVASQPDLYRKEYLSMLYRLITNSTRQGAPNVQDKVLAPLFKAFVVKNAASLFGSSAKPRPSMFELWSVDELPHQVLTYFNTHASRMLPNQFAMRGKVFMWMLEVLDRTGYSISMREKLVSYMLYRYDKTARPGEYDSDDFLKIALRNGAFPWLHQVKRIL